MFHYMEICLVFLTLMGLQEGEPCLRYWSSAPACLYQDGMSTGRADCVSKSLEHVKTLGFLSKFIVPPTENREPAVQSMANSFFMLFPCCLPSLYPPAFQPTTKLSRLDANHFKRPQVD